MLTYGIVMMSFEWSKKSDRNCPYNKALGKSGDLGDVEAECKQLGSKGRVVEGNGTLSKL